MKDIEWEVQELSKVYASACGEERVVERREAQAVNKTVNAERGRCRTAAVGCLPRSGCRTTAPVLRHSLARMRAKEIKQKQSVLSNIAPLWKVRRREKGERMRDIDTL